ncbi:hypothetical protein GGD61_001702 [Bradyrhizobium sp. SBR1B]|nr:hypothetical protein [Bradyrhizobium sp. SBR1B]
MKPSNDFSVIAPLGDGIDDAGFHARNVTQIGASRDTDPATVRMSHRRESAHIAGSPSRANAQLRKSGVHLRKSSTVEQFDPSLCCPVEPQQTYGWAADDPGLIRLLAWGKGGGKAPKCLAFRGGSSVRQHPRRGW